MALGVESIAVNSCYELLLILGIQFPVSDGFHCLSGVVDRNLLELSSLENSLSKTENGENGRSSGSIPIAALFGQIRSWLFYRLMYETRVYILTEQFSFRVTKCLHGVLRSGPSILLTGVILLRHTPFLLGF